MAKHRIIKNGAVVDGSGSPAQITDIEVVDGKIARVARNIQSPAEVIDATGLTVMPGFIDVHSHLDGNVTWESTLKPASGHGITTAVMGNCGVGFAPARIEDRAFNVALMEGVEDIPAAQLNAGLPWSWETFPQYLDLLRERQFDMNVAALLPHSCLRVYVMGQRAIDGEPATKSDLATMQALVEESVRSGAAGVGSTQLVGQKTLSGIPAPSLAADEEEYLAIAQGLGETGILQIAPEFNQYPRAEEELDMVIRVAERTGCKVTYSLKQTNAHPDGWQSLLEKTVAANGRGLCVRPQVLARPTGAIISWDANSHPFLRTPTYREIADLPLDERLLHLRKAAIRNAIIGEAEAKPGGFARLFSRMFPVTDEINYEPAEADSLVAVAEQRGVSIQHLLYELFMQKDGRGIVLLASGNYANYSLDPAFEMLRYEHALPGLGDAGAHSTVICDASATTHLLTYWTRDRIGEKLPLEVIVNKLTAQPAEFFGFTNRGRIQEGYAADINIVDTNALKLHPPHMVYDLPASGRRLVQPVDGFTSILVNGECVHDAGEPTGNLTGRLIGPH